jgi:hypothetical protein
MRFTVTADSLPPRAQEAIHYRVVVRDSETGEPVEGGEGQIFASFEVASGFTHSTGDGFVREPELGTYSGTMNYVAAGSWAVALQFRRDSLSPLARIDWKQDVRAPKPMGG